MSRLRASFSKKYFGGAGVTVEVFEPGDHVTVLFGASGSGKTTILRCLAGLERPDSGRIEFGDEVWFDKGAHVFLPPERRRIGYVPQDYALFPHLSVADNVGYGLFQLTRVERRKRVGEALEWMGIAALASRMPPALSGGEQQRVALARALVRKPQLLLLDEPFSALDAPTRQRLRAELAELLASLNIPSILVTHDRLEAAMLGTEMVVLARGRILQRGSVAEIFNHPVNLEAAQLVGTDTVLACEVLEQADGLARLAIGGVCLTAVAGALRPDAKQAHVCIRAEDVVLSRSPNIPTSSRNHFAATVTRLGDEGPLVRVELDCGFPLKALLTRAASEELNLAPGAAVRVLIKASQVHTI
jgi:molybdate transport system ATP-binding protein